MQGKDVVMPSIFSVQKMAKCVPVAEAQWESSADNILLQTLSKELNTGINVTSPPVVFMTPAEPTVLSGSLISQLLLVET